jgi:hypothetical protein
MADAHARSFKLSLDFLRPGATYQASVYADTPGKLQTTHTSMPVTAKSVVPIPMEPNGGHLMIIEPAAGKTSPGIGPPPLPKTLNFYQLQE